MHATSASNKDNQAGTEGGGVTAVRRVALLALLAILALLALLAIYEQIENLIRCRCWSKVASVHVGEVQSVEKRRRSSWTCVHSRLEPRNCVNAQIAAARTDNPALRTG